MAGPIIDTTPRSLVAISSAATQALGTGIFTTAYNGSSVTYTPTRPQQKAFHEQVEEVLFTPGDDESVRTIQAVQVAAGKISAILTKRLLDEFSVAMGLHVPSIRIHVTKETRPRARQGAYIVRGVLVHDG